MFNSLPIHWQVCIQDAWAGYRVGSLPIAAVVLNEAGEIIGKGRNRVWDNLPMESPRGISAHHLAHAEINALLAADFKASNAKKCVLYTLLEPCPLCIGAIVMANLVHYHYAARCNWAGSTVLLDGSRYMRSKNVRAEGPCEGLFEKAIVAWQLEHNLLVDEVRAQPLLVANEASLPESVEAARRMHQDGMLQKMNQAGKTAQQVFDEICRVVETVS